MLNQATARVGPVGERDEWRPARRRARLNPLPYLLIAPAALMVLGLTVYPAIFALQISLTDANLLRWDDTEFVGLQNYLRTINDDVLTGSLWRTVRWMLVAGVSTLIVAFPVALLLNTNFRGRAFLRTVILIPWVTPVAVQAIMFRFMVDANYGVFNDVLVRLGIIPGYIAWMSDGLTSFLVVSFVQVWASVPFVSVMLLAGLQAIPAELYEAARVDGADGWQRFWYVTRPLLMPLVLLILLLRTIWLAQSIDLLFLLTQGGPGYDNYTLAIYSFKLMWTKMDIGYPAALAIILSIVLIAASIGYYRLMERSRSWM